MAFNLQYHILLSFYYTANCYEVKAKKTRTVGLGFSAKFPSTLN